MDFVDWKNYARRKPFWQKIKQIRYLQQTIDDLVPSANKKNVDPWYKRELKAQMERQEWLYLEIMNEYNHLKAERDLYKKMALEGRRHS